MAATTCRPAFSMSSSDGTPTSSIVRRSASRICLAVRILIGWHLRLPIAGLSTTLSEPSGPPPDLAIVRYGDLAIW